MSDREILEKVIFKAFDNGMPYTIIDKGTFYQVYHQVRGRGPDKIVPKEFVPEDCSGLIFDTEFCQAFWGSKAINIHGADLSHVGTDDDSLKELAHAAANDEKYISGVDPNGVDILEAWQYHIQQMAISENRIQYLAKFIQS